jgi:hypothetical protein
MPCSNAEGKYYYIRFCYDADIDGRRPQSIVSVGLLVSMALLHLHIVIHLNFEGCLANKSTKRMLFLF